jgi:hypothetical protein
MKRKLLPALLGSYFSLGVGAPLPGLLSTLQVNGGMLDAAQAIAVFAQILQNQQAEGQENFATSAGAAITLTSLQNLTQRLTNGGAVVVTLDAAYNIVNQLFNPFVGMQFPFTIVTNAATTVATPTLLDTAVTLSGTTSLVAASLRRYQAQVTQVVTTAGAAVTAGTTFTSLTQVGTSNLYTVALGTNAISPTVGQVIFLNVTAGTLPPGWYPIVKVTSATSFIIAAPLAGTAWTATAATVPGTTVVPVSQYTPGLLGVYSPLMTITGEYSTVTATTAV